MRSYSGVKAIVLNCWLNLFAESMKAVCLPITSELQNQYLDNQPATVAGWGATEDGLQSPVLLSVELPIVSNKDCIKVYRG